MLDNELLYRSRENVSTLVQLGEPTIMQLNIPSIPDEDIPVGQMIILWDEIPIRKIGENLYEVYSDCTTVEVQDGMSSLVEMAERPSLLNAALRMVESYKEVDSLLHFHIPEPPRYTTNSRGQKKKRNYWESPKYF